MNDVDSDILRIAHFTPTYFSRNSVIGGAERYVYNVAKAIHRASIHYKIPIKQEIISFADKSESFEYDGIQVKLLKNTSLYSDKMGVLSEELWDLINHVDVAHIHQSLTIFGAYVTALLRSRSIPIIATDLGGGNNELMLYGKGLELAHSVVSISEYAKSLILSHYSGNHKVLIGPVDTDFFCPAPGGGKSAICVSRILPHKGIDRIIAALPDDFPLKVVGQVYDESYLALLRKLSKNKCVEFIHDANDQGLVQLYNSSGLFLQASTHKDCYGNIIHKPELMGLTTLEAMSCGLPVIVSDGGSLPELIKDSRFGQVFLTQEDLHNKLLAFMNGDWPDFEASHLARQYVVNNFSFLTIGNNLLQLYKKAFET